MDKDTQSTIKQKWLCYIAAGLVGLAMVGVVACQGAVSSLPGQRNGGDTALEASGIIQVEQVSIASEFGGRIVEISVAEGDKVAAGDLLVRLDTELLDAQIEAIEATIELAEAGVAQAKAGARPGQIGVALQIRESLTAAQKALAEPLRRSVELVVIA